MQRIHPARTAGQAGRLRVVVVERDHRLARAARARACPSVSTSAGSKCPPTHVSHSSCSSWSGSAIASRNALRQSRPTSRSEWAPFYVRGLLGPDGPKSVQPIAARLGLRNHDQLHHFVSSRAWDDAPLWRVLAERADRLVGGDDAVLVVDDTALPKKGTASAGMAPQYCGALGKQANCQSLVSLTLARHEVPIPVGLRLFLPAVWTGTPCPLRPGWHS